jgi:hypothetical protein
MLAHFTGAFDECPCKFLSYASSEGVFGYAVIKMQD